jgi:hypothetical protein
MSNRRCLDDSKVEVVISRPAECPLQSQGPGLEIGIVEAAINPAQIHSLLAGSQIASEEKEAAINIGRPRAAKMKYRGFSSPSVSRT